MDVLGINFYFIAGEKVYVLLTRNMFIRLFTWGISLVWVMLFLHQGFVFMHSQKQNSKVEKGMRILGECKFDNKHTTACKLLVSL